jgi:hypothetical protein
MPFPMVPPPLDEEWLGHWLLRVADRYGLRIARLLERTPRFLFPPRSQPWTGRLECPDEQWAALAYATRREPGLLKAMQALYFPAERAPERGFGRICLAGDLVSPGFPYWRRHWMDPCYVWCHRHDCMLDPYPKLTTLGQGAYGMVAKKLSELAAQGGADHLPDGIPPWIQAVARRACLPGHWYATQGGDSRPIVAELLDSIVASICVACYDDDADQELAMLVGAPRARDLRFKELGRIRVTARSYIGQICLLRHQSWLLGLATQIASFRQSDGALHFSAATRNWLWKHLYAVGAGRLVTAVRQARRAGLIAAWSEVEQWTPPSSPAAWFRHVA